MSATHSLSTLATGVHSGASRPNNSNLCSANQSLDCGLLLPTTVAATIISF
jgi:hypothetical protein